MSKNLTDLEVFLEKYNTLLTGLASSKIYLETAYKYQDFYGEWGMTSLRFITPFLWIFPLIASSLLTMSFKRQKLTGSMQKCMISLMAFDVFFCRINWRKGCSFKCLAWELWLCRVQNLFLSSHFYPLSNYHSWNLSLDQISNAHSPSAHIPFSINI